MNRARNTVRLTEVPQPVTDEREEILAGLRDRPKHVSPKFFYDERGSQLFEEICEQPEYYPTRTELDIMEDNLDEMANLLGTAVSLIEYGSGSSTKTRLLLDQLQDPAAYVPVDISKEHLASTAEQLAADYPDLEVLPVCTDFTKPFPLPVPSRAGARNVVYFPGSTIGNFNIDEAVGLMKVMRGEAGDRGGLLIGVDLVKARDVLERAYNDAAGVTAEFNLNLLCRLNREHDADFELENFRHEAIYDEQHQCIEMRLIAQDEQTVQVGNESFEFEEGEALVTEHSHKFTVDQFAELAARAGFELRKVWTDDAELFSVQYLDAA
ncbi:MAG: L-histidine N(alpha)-methyltransferase [Chromatiales bacterium]|nr:MAG: L-histidine N(alpha)-methyltransferase [Chromatiales bacterium]